MSTNTEKAPFETPAERAAKRIDLDTQGESGGADDSMTLRRLSVEVIGLAAAVVATVVTYELFTVHPAHTPLHDFLVMFDRGNAAIWPMQLVWYASAAIPMGERSRIAYALYRRHWKRYILLSEPVVSWACVSAPMNSLPGQV